MLTRKHFETIARILASNGANTDIVEDFTSYLRTTNPRFDADRFRQAAQD